MLCRTKWGEEVKILVGPPQKRVELVLPHHETVVFRGSQSSNAGVIIMKVGCVCLVENGQSYVVCSFQFCTYYIHKSACIIT